jgi:hypothetical protein
MKFAHAHICHRKMQDYQGCPLAFFAKASFQILCVNFSTQTVMRNDSTDDLERLDAANVHCEMHYFLRSIPHTNLTTL